MLHNLPLTSFKDAFTAFINIAKLAGIFLTTMLLMSWLSLPSNQTISWHICYLIKCCLLWCFLLVCEGTDSRVIFHVRIKAFSLALVPMWSTWQSSYVSMFVCSNFRTRKLGLQNHIYQINIFVFLTEHV